MRGFLSKLWNGWLTFRYGKPCQKHPGHRNSEYDVETETQCAMMPSMCSECWAEEKERLNL